MRGDWLIERLVKLLDSIVQPKRYLSPSPAPVDRRENDLYARDIERAGRAPTAGSKPSPRPSPNSRSVHLQRALLGASSRKALGLSFRLSPSQHALQHNSHGVAPQRSSLPGPEAQTTRSTRLSWPPADEQVRQLVSRLKKTHGGESIPAQRMGDLYRQFCHVRSWRPRPWNQVGKELKALLGGRPGGDQEAWYDEDGKRHKRRTYHVPKPGTALPLHGSKQRRRRARRLNTMGTAPNAI